VAKHKYPPGAGLIRSIAYQSLSLSKALAEWIDNSLDSGAKKIRLTLRNDIAQIEDDGLGTPNPHLLVQLGERQDHDSTALGMHGIGAKDCLLWIGKEHSTVNIDTVFEGTRRTLRCDWADFADEWELEDPTEEPSEGATGTVITVSPNKVTIPSGQHWQTLVNDLGYLYSKAIKDGARILIKGPKRGAQFEEIQRWQPPPFDGDYIDEHISVGGKRARVVCGVVKKGETNRRCGLTYFCGFRVIEKASDNGCGVFNTANICGFVELIDRQAWILNKNKDGFQDAEALYAAVEDVCRPILERGDAIGSELASSLFENSIADRLNAALGRASAGRNPGNKPGTNQPRNTERAQRSTSNPRGPGKYQAGSPLSLKHGHLGEDAGFGDVKTHSVVLNLDNPLIGSAYESRDVLAATIAALSLIGYEHCHPRGKQLKLRIDDSDFARVVGQLMSDSLLVDGKRVTDLKAVKDVA
jgi:hypothetical protein